MHSNDFPMNIAHRRRKQGGEGAVAPLDSESLESKSEVK